MRGMRDWEEVLKAAAELQQIIPGAVLVGGTAAAIHAGHRVSLDADHVINDLAERFDDLLEFLETRKKWITRRVQPPKMILGNFHGVETGIRQLIRTFPLETKQVRFQDRLIVVPTPEEMLRVKGWLVLTRNATRDYIGLAALSAFIDKERSSDALKNFDTCYRDIYKEREISPLLQLGRQLSEPRPYDLDDIDIKNYKGIVAPWDSWDNIKKQCEDISYLISIILTE
jgi:hypothetical protein